MADALGNLLPRNQYQEPPEVQIIKQFMDDQFQQTVGVTIQTGHIIIQVKNSGLAGALRPRLHELQDLCHTKKRLIIRIS